MVKSYATELFQSAWVKREGTEIFETDEIKSRGDNVEREDVDFPLEREKRIAGVLRDRAKIKYYLLAQRSPENTKLMPRIEQIKTEVGEKSIVLGLVAKNAVR